MTAVLQGDTHIHDINMNTCGVVKRFSMYKLNAALLLLAGQCAAARQRRRALSAARNADVGSARLTAGRACARPRAGEHQVRHAQRRERDPQLRPHAGGPGGRHPGRHRLLLRVLLVHGLHRVALERHGHPEGARCEPVMAAGLAPASSLVAGSSGVFDFVLAFIFIECGGLTYKSSMLWQKHWHARLVSMPAQIPSPHSTRGAQGLVAMNQSTQYRVAAHTLRRP